MSSCEELPGQQGWIFSDSLQDLKSLRGQLYSAAEYFELSYTNDDDEKHIVVSTLRDYAVQALVNTVDHLGSISYKVNGLLDEKVEDVSGTELRVACMEQRIRTCQEYMGHEGLGQQSLVISAPKYHKHYIFPAAKTMGRSSDATRHRDFSWGEMDDWNALCGVQSASRETSSSSLNESLSSSLTRRKSDHRVKRSLSPLSISRSLIRSGSLSRSSASSPDQSAVNLNLHSGWKSASVRMPVDKNPKEMDQIPSKSKRFLKAFLRRRKVKDDPALYSYLDEY